MPAGSGPGVRRAGAAGSLGVGMPAVSFVVNGSLAGVSGRFVPLCREFAKRNGWTAEFHVTDKAEAGVARPGERPSTAPTWWWRSAGTGPSAAAPRGWRRPASRSGSSRTAPRTCWRGRSASPATRTRRSTSRSAPRPTVDRRIDLAIADREPFTAMAGMGLDAAVVAGTKLKHQLGWLAYAMSGAVHLALPPTRFTIKLDDGPPIERTARSVVVGNSGLLPGGFSLLPDARLDDGVLDVGVLAPHGPLRLAAGGHPGADPQPPPGPDARAVPGAQGGDHLAASRSPARWTARSSPPASTLTVTVQPSTLTVRMPMKLRQAAIGATVKR